MPYWSSKVAFYIIYLEKENVLTKFFQPPIVSWKMTTTATTTNSGIPDPSAVSMRKKTLFVRALHSASPSSLNVIWWSDLSLGCDWACSSFATFPKPVCQKDHMSMWSGRAKSGDVWLNLRVWF